MPVAFPSHQGVLCLLWRRWPRSFDVLALCVGALTPDVVDGIASLTLRGRLGQWGGHSLLGLFTACTAAGLLMNLGLRRFADAFDGRDPRARPPPRHARVIQWVRRWLRDIDSLRTFPSPSAASRWVREVASLWIGILSHDITDLLSHEQSLLLWPFRSDPRWFGGWWYETWFRAPVPGYGGYPIGWHFVSWLLVSIGGALLFLRWPPIRR